MKALEGIVKAYQGLVRPIKAPKTHSNKPERATKECRLRIWWTTLSLRTNKPRLKKSNLAIKQDRLKPTESAWNLNNFHKAKSSWNMYDAYQNIHKPYKHSMRNLPSHLADGNETCMNPQQKCAKAIEQNNL